MNTGQLRRELRRDAPNLSKELDSLVSNWLAGLLDRIDTDKPVDEFRPKQVNDPIWGTVELRPWEVALLDTPLLQRMRGVKQLGLASLVFPSASHDRLEHILGVVGATERMIYALTQQIERWNRDNANKPLPQIEQKDRYALRLAALLHDIGHGPFSHALEPVLETNSVLLDDNNSSSETNWRTDLKTAQTILKKNYSLNKLPALGEVLAAKMVLTEPMYNVLGSDRIFTERGRTVDELLEFIVAAIVGGVEGPGATHLTAIISSQIDADKLDYLARDAHHSGLEIGFDTDRLLSRLEILKVTPDNIDSNASGLRERAAQSTDQTFHQLGIAASGFGSFEQMLIGRTFLYDRLYHHHKVRAAEAMAQRLMIVAERDRRIRFGLDEIFVSLGDDTMLRTFSGEVTHKNLKASSPAAASLAKGILNRELLHRAYAFRGRFVTAPPGFNRERTDLHRQAVWRRVVKELESLRNRYSLGVEIHDVARRCAAAISESGDDPRMGRYIEALDELGPEHIIVDLPESKAGAIRLLARYPNGALKVPEFSFNPIKWSDAYEIQKRTGYVFSPRAVIPIVALASRIVFLSRFGVTMSRESDGYIKAGQSVPEQWLEALVNANIIYQDAANFLNTQRYSLLQVRADDLKLPQEWIASDPDIAHRLAQQLNDHLRGGLTAEHLKALGEVLEAIYAFIETWYSSERVTQALEDEGALQSRIRDCFRHRELKVQEGAEVGGGELDLYVQDAILVENKFREQVAKPAEVAPSSGMQGRRYAIALNSQVVIVLLGYTPKPGQFPNKSQSVSISPILQPDTDRVEIRVTVPYNAVRPSDEKAKST